MKNLLALIWGLTAVSVSGCIWDARTLRLEKKMLPDLATIILNAGKRKTVDPVLRAEIEQLRLRPEPDNAEWVNNLAGTYLRIGEPAQALMLLEPARGRFPYNYGVRANIGTAYHLLGRYADAEREIARDLEINPEAHFGLEKYHLALLQYLVRDRAYQLRHLYIDEWSTDFFTRMGTQLRWINHDKSEVLPEDYKPASRKEIDDNKIAASASRAPVPTPELFDLILEAEGDVPPAYRFKWDLAADTNATRGVMYMAELNPKEPAAMVMAGLVAVRNRAYHLGIAAYERAIALGSPQADLLKLHIANLEEYIQASKWQGRGLYQRVFGIIAGIGVLSVGLHVWIRSNKRRTV